MATLLVKLRGQDISRTTLVSGREYIVGRSFDADIPLAEERGISRQHLKLYEKDGIWVCESLSKFAMVHMDGESHPVVELSQTCAFAVPPYDFLFELENEPTHQRTITRKTDAKSSPIENFPVAQNTGSHSSYNTHNTDATIAGNFTSRIPYIRISFPDTADDEVLKLEGNLWVAGRDANCEISLDSAHISRKHFELVRTQEGFYLTDLGSSNGTKVNGQRVTAHEPKQIESGDEISIKTIRLVFEIRDGTFDQRVSQYPAVSPRLPVVQENPYPETWQQSPVGNEDPTVFRVPNREPEAPKTWRDFRLTDLRDPDVRKKAIRYSVIAFVLIGFLKSMSSGDKPKDTSPEGKSAEEKAAANPTFEKLAAEQRSVIKDSFNLARNLYVQGKYELCLTELAKVHELIPLFENSKELESFCAQGKELVHRQRDLDRKERERQAIDSQISGYIDACKSKVTSMSTVDEVRTCLVEAMELNPEHPTIIEMIHNAQANEDERKIFIAQRDVERRRAAKGTAQYNKARSLYKEGQLAKAMTEYETFINTAYPGLDGVKSTARRELASIKDEFKKKISNLTETCTNLSKSGKYKEAHAACDKALVEDSTNTLAKETRRRMVNELRKEMKAIYEDSVLEESLGNVDSAKEKWKKIVAEDLPTGDYSLKAKSKLQKYGLGN